MDITVKRVYAPASEDDGFRVLADRLWPRGISKERAHIDTWAKDVAPSPELRTWFAHDPAKWDAFQERYRAELKANPQPLADLRDMLHGKKKITLVYGAKDEEHNQAVVLRKVLLEE